MLECENNILNSCNQSRHMTEYTLNNNLGNGKMIHRYNLKRNNNESKHTAYLISRNKVDTSTYNRSDSEITRKNISNYNPNNNATTHENTHLQRRHESSHIFFSTNMNIVNNDINKYEVEQINK